MELDRFVRAVRDPDVRESIYSRKLAPDFARQQKEIRQSLQVVPFSTILMNRRPRRNCMISLPHWQFWRRISPTTKDLLGFTLHPQLESTELLIASCHVCKCYHPRWLRWKDACNRLKEYGLGLRMRRTLSWNQVLVPRLQLTGQACLVPLQPAEVVQSKLLVWALVLEFGVAHYERQCWTKDWIHGRRMK